MGCDIYSVAQVQDDYGNWNFVNPGFPGWDENTTTYEPFNWRHYGMYGFIANVHNYSFVPVLAGARGYPPDLSECDDYINDHWLGEHSHSWLLVSELAEFDYNQTFENRRTMRNGDGRADTGPGNGEITTYREFLGKNFFRDLGILKSLNPDHNKIRIVFGFGS